MQSLFLTHSKCSSISVNHKSILSSKISVQLVVDHQLLRFSKPDYTTKTKTSVPHCSFINMAMCTVRSGSQSQCRKKKFGERRNTEKGYKLE